MKKSNLDYAKEFEACEKENLTHTENIQAGFDLIAVGNNNEIHASIDLLDNPEDIISDINSKTTNGYETGKYTLFNTKHYGAWIMHKSGDYRIFERIKWLPPIDKMPDSDVEISSTIISSRGNFYKYCELLCKTIRHPLRADRVMVYRFHDDWSGEVIAESIEPALEPFLGLHYPPTDIPSQARRLFEVIGSRHIFSIQPDTIAINTQNEGAPTPDLGHAISRSVSPYHIEYLSNMGSQGTASCSILVEGKLWGLISIHYERPRAPNFNEVLMLQKLSKQVSSDIAELSEQSKKHNQNRLRRLSSRFDLHLEMHSDPFMTLIMSDQSIHRALNADGASLIIGSKFCNVGATPAIPGLEAIIKTYGEDLEPFKSVFIESIALPDDIPQDVLNGIAGCAITRLSADPDTYLIAHRREYNQTVVWGGDPRRQSSNDEAERYTPRQSFNQWVETVQGRCRPWSSLDKSAVHLHMVALENFFQMSPRELALLIGNGLRQAVRKRDIVKSTVTDVLDGLQVAIAVAVEETGAEEGRIMALNRYASEAFTISQTEAPDVPVSELESVLGVDLTDVGNESSTLTINTPNYGVREYEMKTNLMFEYIDQDSNTRPYRVKLFELRDVTEAKRLEQSLVAAKNRAVKAAEVRDEYFTKLGYELRSPLNGLIGVSKILLNAGSDDVPKSVRANLTLIHEIAEHLGGLVDTTLQNTAQLSALDPENAQMLRVSDLIEDAWAALKDKAAENNTQMLLSCEKNLRVFADPRGVSQVLANVLDNAVRDSAQDQDVTITVSQDDNQRVEIEISDQGVGMTQDELNERMTLKGSRNTKDSQLWLGLSVSRSLTALMGGRMKVTSAPGQGVTVRLDLPASQVAVQAETVSHAS